MPSCHSSLRNALLLLLMGLASARGDYAPDGISSLWFHGGGDVQRLQAEARDIAEADPSSSIRLHIRLPASLPEDPVLVIANPGCGRLELSWDGQTRYRSGADRPGPFASRAANAVHWIPLPAEAGGATLELRLEDAASPDPAAGRPMTLLASSTHLLRQLAGAAIPRLMLALFFLMVGLYAGLAWFVRRRYGVPFSPWFAALTLLVGLAMLAATAMEFLPPALAARLYPAGLLVMLLFPAALWRFMEESLGRGRWSLIRRCWQLQLVAAAVLWIPDVLGIRPFAAPAQMLGNGLIALQLCVGLGEGLRHVRNPDPSRRWTARGILVFSVAALVDIVVSFFTGNPDVELYPLGLLALILLLAWNQERAAGEAQRTLRRQAEELREHRDRLEARVDQRTRELREAMLAAESASRAKGDFLANMSHEVRTPLNAILGHAQRLRHADSPPDTRERGEVIRQSAEHLLALINDVLDLARIEAGRLPLETADTDLPDLLQGVLRMLRPRAEEKGLALDLETDGSLPGRIETDPRRLRQILLNLLGNAIKFTDQGRVTLQVACDDGRLSCEVIDTGPGLGPDGPDPLFEPFERTARDARREGTGLGLAISRQLARALGGDLTARTNPEVGSTFHFTCPCRILDNTRKSLPETRTPRPAQSASRPNPLPESYAPLRDAARIGDLTTVLNLLPALRHQHPGHQPFLDELEHLARAFDLDRLQHLLAPDG